MEKIREIHAAGVRVAPDPVEYVEGWFNPRRRHSTSWLHRNDRLEWRWPS